MGGENRLPRSMDGIVEAVGYSPAISLVHIYGGGRVFVPLRKNMTEKHPLADLLGISLALRLADAYGGEELRLPMGDKVFATAREAQIIAAWNAGESAQAIGRRFWVTDRAVRLVVGRARAAGMPIIERRPPRTRENGKLTAQIAPGRALRAQLRCCV